MSTLTHPTYGYRAMQAEYAPTPHPDLIRPPVMPIKAVGGPVLNTPAEDAPFEGAFEGWACIFDDGSCSTRDAVRDAFSAKCDFGLEFAAATPVYWHHALTPGKGERIGVAQLERKAAGLWASVKLNPDLDAAERRRIGDLARRSKLWFSTGSSSHLVRREAGPGGACRVITRWPLAELSVTESPASRLATVDPSSVKATPKAPAAPRGVKPDPALVARTRRLLDDTKAFLAEQQAEADRKVREWQEWKAEQDRLDREFAEMESWKARREAEEKARLDRDRGDITRRVEALNAWQAEQEARKCHCGCGSVDACISQERLADTLADARATLDAARARQADRIDREMKAALDDLDDRGLVVPESGVAFRGLCLLYDGIACDGPIVGYCTKGTDFGLGNGEAKLVHLLHDHDGRESIGVARISRHWSSPGIACEAIVDTTTDAGRAALLTLRRSGSFGFSTGAPGGAWGDESEIKTLPDGTAMRWIARRRIREVSLCHATANPFLSRFARNDGMHVTTRRPSPWQNGPRTPDEMAAEATRRFLGRGLAGFGH